MPLKELYIGSENIRETVLWENLKTDERVLWAREVIAVQDKAATDVMILIETVEDWGIVDPDTFEQPPATTPEENEGVGNGEKPTIKSLILQGKLKERIFKLSFMPSSNMDGWSLVIAKKNKEPIPTGGFREVYKFVKFLWTPNQ